LLIVPDGNCEVVVDKAVEDPDAPETVPEIETIEVDTAVLILMGISLGQLNCPLTLKQIKSPKLPEKSAKLPCPVETVPGKEPIYDGFAPLTAESASRQSCC
jgi:hypothetical protein